MRNKVFVVIALLVGSLMLSGCWDGTEVTKHEPGIYKGPVDPLLSTGPQAAALAERFNMVQTDR